MDKFIETLNRIVWGAPALVMIVGVGIVLTIRTRGAQFKLFPLALKNFVEKLSGKGHKTEGVSSFQALCTALAATVGTGNIAGVAGAIALGGPGTIFWMWVSAIFGMITKAAEVVLAVYYRRNGNNGDYFGGPMYIIRNAMDKRWRWLALLYAFFGVVAAFGMGNATQINAVIGSVHSAANAVGMTVDNKCDWIIGLVAGAAVAVLLLGGAKRVGRFAEILVPFVSLAYILICLGVIFARIQLLPQAVVRIFQGAFTPKAVTGGAVGSAFYAFRTGISRGVFTNEAGMGTASIAHAGADAEHPVQQGLMGIMEVFLDTIVICTMTAFAILCSGVKISYGIDEGVMLTTEAFASVYGGWINVALMLFLCVFAFATMLGWGLYGVRCAQYLFGERAWRWFVILQIAVITLSTLLKTGTVWMLAETVNGLMAIPNLIAIWVLMPVTVKLINNYSNKIEHT